ncbi:MAG: EutN/CcmL family microcompartment protein [Clostridia bacterium]|nr:EutN/CcmL family microcompartment protein [Clostridia bacterium]
MIIGKVTGSVVSTRKEEKLIGSKFMIVELLNMNKGETKNIVAVDNIGAGIGEFVLVATGSAARKVLNAENSPVDAAIVGIIDSGEGLEN